MESHLHHAIAVLGRACSTAISVKPISLDQSLCLGLADCLEVAAQQLTEVQNEIESVVQEYPGLFRELNRVAYRAQVLVERCCTKEWLRVLFLQACTSHKEDALDVIDDLEWCLAEIWKISRLPRHQRQSLLKFKELIEECEDFDQGKSLKQLESHGLVLKECECLDRRGFLKQLSSHTGLVRVLKECEDLGQQESLKQLKSHTLLPLVKRELQLTKYLLERIKVQRVPSTPRAIEISLDCRNFYPIGANGFTDSEQLGQGSAAKVYKTKFLGIQCARKVQTASNADELQGLAKQASKLAPLSHPHVMKLLGFYADKRIVEGIYVYEGHWLMECMDGDLLNNIRERLNPYPVAVDVMLQIAKGVRYLHENGIAHRDLKCSNLLVSLPPTISSNGATWAHQDYVHIKVSDFDQSKFLIGNCPDLQVLSKPNVGSSPWRAPEAFTERGESAVHLVNSKSADSYSFAMTCFELLSGENPFDAMPGISWTKAKVALIAGRRPPLPKDCPELLRELIVECWRTNPMQRPAFPEICARLLDVRAFLLTGSLTQRNRQRDALSFWRHNAQRVVSIFKNMRMAVSSTRKQISSLRAAVPEMQAPCTCSNVVENVQQVPEIDLLHSQGHRTLKTARVIVGLDFGTTHTGVAYAMVSNPDEIFTICHWPLVGEEVYHCKTLTATYKPTPNGDCLWGYPARREYGKTVRGNDRSSGIGSYFGGLKQSLSNNDTGPDRQSVIDYLRELGKFVLGYLQLEYPLEFLEMDLLRWCITVPHDWGSGSKQSLSACMVNAGLVRGQVELENFPSSFDFFVESNAAACYCNANFAHVNMKKGDRLCVLDVGGGTVQCVFEDWEGAGQWSCDSTKKRYGVKSPGIESLVQENFLKFILGERHGRYNFSQLMRDDPSLWMTLLDELDSLKADLNHSIKIPSNMLRLSETDEFHRLESPKFMGGLDASRCALNTEPSGELCPSSSDTKFIFKPLVDGVVSFLQEQLQLEPDVKRLFVVGGYVKHVYFMEEIRRSFPNLRVDTPKNPGSAVCKGAVALGLMKHFEFQSGLTGGAPSDDGEEGTSHDDGKSGDNHQLDQPESSEKANPSSHSYSNFGNTSHTKGLKQVDSKDQMDVDSGREKLLVALDFGTSQMGFAYGFESQPGEVAVCKDDQRRSTDLYYKLCHDTLRWHSCGQKAKDAVCEDFTQEPSDSQNYAPALGAYVSKPKLHLVVDDIDPEVKLHLPEGLTIDDAISDCLREYGHFIVIQLQHRFGNDFKLHHIQWCLLVPSFWGEDAKRRMEACMISARLLRGPNGVDGSPYPLVTVLEAEAASTACVKHFSLCEGFRYLVVSIGAGTLDMVIQEWIGEFGTYDMKEVSTSSGGFYGSSCLDLNFLALLSLKMGVWVNDYLQHFPLVLIDLMSQWEHIKVEYSDECELKLYVLHLPMQVQKAWQRVEYQSATRKAGTSYESLELTSDDVRMVFEPVVRAILEQIAAQLATSTYVDALVVVGGFAKSPYLYGQIVRKFGDQCLLRIANSESVVLRGAVLCAQYPKGIRSRIARKTYGLGMRRADSKAELSGTGEISNEVERFCINVEKGSSVGVDCYVESYHQPICRGQKSMRFSLYSSVESYPQFTGEQSVTREWDFVVHICDSLELKDEPNIRIRLYYGRSAVGVVAEVVNFGTLKQLPVTFVVGGQNVNKRLDAGVAKKTYGVRSNRCFEVWDVPEYRVTHGVDQEDSTCDFSFEIFIRRGTALDSFVSRTYHPIYDKQRSLSFALYSSTDVTPRYITDESAAKEGDLEVDILKGLYLDKDREISLRMSFTRTNILISAVALNFAGEDRNLPIRLRYGSWGSQVGLTLARQLRMVPVKPSSSVRGKGPEQKAIVLAMPPFSRQCDQERGSWQSDESTRDRPLPLATTSQPRLSDETNTVHPIHEHLEPLYADIEALMRERREGSRSGAEALVRVVERLDLRSEETITEETKGLENEREEARIEKDKFVEELFDRALQLMDQMTGLLKGAAPLQDLEIPAEFRCPLSGELMSDPVIVASGQTYERKYIQHWLREGHTQCPRTRRQLCHMSLIPNYTVKALIAYWCKTHDLPVPEQVELKPNYTCNVHLLSADADSELPSPTGTMPSGFRSSGRRITLNSGSVRVRKQSSRLSNPRGHRRMEESVSVRLEVNEGEPSQSLRDPSPALQGTGPRCLPSKLAPEKCRDSPDVCGHVSMPDEAGSEVSGSGIGSGLLNESLGAPASQPERSTFGRRCEMDSIIRLPLIVPYTSGVGSSSAQGEIERWVQDLQSSEVHRQRQAACELRMLAKNNIENRVMIASSGAIEPLVLLLGTEDRKTQENSVTALLNLSINDNNKVKIVRAGAIDPLVNLLSVGNSETMENAAATLFSLSVYDDNKVTIGDSGAIRPLVHLLINGRPRGMKDAAIALFNLSLHHANKARVVNAGAVRPLVEMMTDRAAGFGDKAVAVLANLATIPEGRMAIVEHQGISALVDEVEDGSQRGKENAVAVLFQLCTNSNIHRSLVFQEGVIPPLVILSQSGTPRGKEKASALLRHFRECRILAGRRGRSSGPHLV